MTISNTNNIEIDAMVARSRAATIPTREDIYALVEEVETLQGYKQAADGLLARIRELEADLAELRAELTAKEAENAELRRRAVVAEEALRLDPHIDLDTTYEWLFDCHDTFYVLGEHNTKEWIGWGSGWANMCYAIAEAELDAQEEQGKVAEREATQYTFSAAETPQQAAEAVKSALQQEGTPNA